MAFSAIQNPLELWPSTITGLQCTHPSWVADGTVEQVPSRPATLLLTPVTPNATWLTQPRPSSFPPSSATTLLNFSVSKGCYLILDNGVDPAELVKVQDVNDVYCYLEAAPSATYNAGSRCNIVDPVGYSPVRAFILKNVGASAGSITNAFGFTRSFEAGETETVGSDWTLAQPLMIDGTGTTITLDVVQR